MDNNSSNSHCKLCNYCLNRSGDIWLSVRHKYINIKKLKIGDII
jgi:hypothetical protein